MMNLFPGFSRMMAFTCRTCGEVARVSDDPSVERIFRPENEDGQREDD